jgi:hypothetical protein
MPELVFEFEFFALLGRIDFRAGPFGRRILFRGTGGGIVHGGRLSGVMEGPGGDWFLSGVDGYGRVDVRSNIRTTDDAFIYMQYQGLVRLTPAVLAMLDGEPDRGGEDGQYFFTAPRLETGDPRYAWVNQTMFVGEGRVSTGPRVDYRIYRVAKGAGDPSPEGRVVSSYIKSLTAEVEQVWIGRCRASGDS